MGAAWTRAWGLTATVTLLALAGSAGLAGAQARLAADSVTEGATKIVQGVQETAKGIGKTSMEGATTVSLAGVLTGSQGSLESLGTEGY